MVCGLILWVESVLPDVGSGEVVRGDATAHEAAYFRGATGRFVVGDLTNLAWDLGFQWTIAFTAGLRTPGKGPRTMDENLLERLSDGQDADAWRQVAATAPDHDQLDGAEKDAKLTQLLARINRLASGSEDEAVASEASAQAMEPSAAGFAEESQTQFFPVEPTSFHEASLSESEVETLALKFLLARGDASGRDIADQVKLPFVLIDDLLRQLKHEQLVFYRDSAPMNDYLYQLTDLGRERARRLTEHCTYFGSAPVALEDYIESVKQQSIEGQHPTCEDLKRAFSDLLINPQMLTRLGPAINSGRGLFLYGAPGNGKTSIAERVTSAFGKYIWIPRAIGVDGEVMRLFDPMNHEEAPMDSPSGILHDSKVDKRWVRIKRPTIVVGGELTMDNLEVSQNHGTGISESPMQLKSNCGTLVIDDFGRQTMSTDELLNRWIVPLEKRYDFLNLGNGKKIQVPFDQLIVFSTNLEPRDLVDEAFLRRIPYKIEVVDPSEDEFRKLFDIFAPRIGFELNREAITHLIESHYKSVGRPFRNCQPRDLLMQVRNHCLYMDKELILTPEAFDFAAENYFAVM